VAAKKIKKDFKQFKKTNLEYNLFCFGHINSSIENQTIINKIMLKIWREEKRLPKNEEKSVL
jgi:hypothetical protein